jgi:hypothetical protein
MIPAMSKRTSCVLLVACALLVQALASGASGATVRVEVHPESEVERESARSSALELALRKVRDMRRVADPALADGVEIVLQDGVHRLAEALRLRPEDSGTPQHPLRIVAAPGARPVLSGGIVVGGWKRPSSAPAGLSTAARAHVLVAEVPEFRGRPMEFRQMWVGGRKAVRAKSHDEGDFARLVEWRREAGEAVIDAALLRDVRVGDGVEMFLLQQWETANLRLKDVRVEGDRAVVRFHEPEAKIQSEHPWPQPIMSETFRAPFLLVGAIEFLDRPGEWHLDRREGKIYYWPREGEDPTRLEAVVPALETLVEVAGSPDRPVRHVEFHGIQFSHTTWLRPSLEGHVPLQAGFPMLEAYKLVPRGTPEWRSLDNQAWLLRPPAAVEVRDGHEVVFRRCRFESLAMTGLDFVRGSRGGAVEGCVFRDIGGNGIQAGSYQDEEEETHLPFAPAGDRGVCAGLRIGDNVLTDCGTEDWGCVAISAGFVREFTIEHNEIFDLPYSGVSLGWGWTRSPNVMRNNVVRANHIHRVSRKMYDTAGIYTLSAQPGSLVAENAIHSIVMSPWVEKPHWGHIYLDEGSAFMVVRDNWCDGEKFVRNANGPGNHWDNNGPHVDPQIRARAGLRPAYRDLLDGL